MKLYTKILLALIAGAAIGIVAKALEITWLRDTVIALEPIGTAFIRLMTMIVLPLVVSSLLVGTASLGDAQRVGRVGGERAVLDDRAGRRLLGALLGIFDVRAPCNQGERDDERDGVLHGVHR